MSVSCTQCGSPTKPTMTRPRRSDGKTFPILECTGKCVNDKGYPFSFFPPKQRSQVPSNGSNSGSNALLQAILNEIKQIKTHLLGQTEGGDFPAELKNNEEQF